ncbi:MAG TPA: glycosyltransferase family 4 protein [Solirubrobacteraceae bacterium]|jgi:glycosyltransferase involved in cell wall biosynthesis|nr:glycosyltransferase family 4 protein [Solirubrobacteraceae bacterium]
MRVCLVYDCLYPYTVGGAERWYRNLAERLLQEGHEITYLTLRQWPRGERLELDPRIRVVVAGPRMALYTVPPAPRRRILPPLVFGAGVLWHLLRHGRSYDVVHTCAFPYFSLLAAALARPLGRYGLVVDWFEVWSGEYWRGYLGGLGGRAGELVQRVCAHVPQRAFCFSLLHAERLRELGLRGPITVLRGLYAGASKSQPPARARGTRPFEGPPLAQTPTHAGGEQSPAENSKNDVHNTPPFAENSKNDVHKTPPFAENPKHDIHNTPPLVLFAGRLIPEKRVTVGVAAVARAAQRIAGLQGVFYGDGPERDALHRAISEHDAAGFIFAPGFAAGEQVDADMSRALCVLLPSEREGYGMVVVEASAHSTPAVVVAAPDNAAVELVEQDVNGVVASSADPEAIAAAIVRVYEAGAAMRESTARWFAENAELLSLEGSLRVVLVSYAHRQAV